MGNIFPSSHSHVAWTSIVKRPDRPKIPSIVSYITNGDERCVRVASNPLVTLETGQRFQTNSESVPVEQRSWHSDPSYVSCAYNRVVSKASPLTLALGPQEMLIRFRRVVPLYDYSIYLI